MEWFPLKLVPFARAADASSKRLACWHLLDGRPLCEHQCVTKRLPLVQILSSGRTALPPRPTSIGGFVGMAVAHPAPWESKVGFLHSCTRIGCVCMRSECRRVHPFSTLGVVAGCLPPSSLPDGSMRRGSMAFHFRSPAPVFHNTSAPAVALSGSSESDKNSPIARRLSGRCQTYKPTTAAGRRSPRSSTNGEEINRVIRAGAYAYRSHGNRSTRTLRSPTRRSRRICRAIQFFNLR